MKATPGLNAQPLIWTEAWGACACSPIFAGCLASCMPKGPSAERELISIPIQGQGAYTKAVDALLHLLYAQEPQKVLGTMESRQTDLYDAVRLAHVYNIPWVIRMLDEYMLGLKGDALVMSYLHKIDNAMKWLKFACWVGLHEFRLIIEQHLMAHAQLFASLPEVASSDAVCLPAINERYVQSLAMVMRGSLIHARERRVPSIATIRGWHEQCTSNKSA